MNGRTNKRKQLFVAITMLGLLLCSAEAFSAINNAGIMDTVLNRFKTNASLWASIIESVATRLFWTLALISMVWTFGMMALRKADIGEFFAELIRFTVFTGFFWWLLINGPNFSISIIDSLMQVGGSAAAIGNYSGSFSPSGIVDIGFTLFGKTLGESSIWSPADSMIGIVLGLGILMLTAMIAVNMLLLLISAWILAYGGIFFLGFGGARWTHDMAINYYKTVLGIAIQIMTMILLIAIGVSLINDHYINMQTDIEFSEMAVVLIVTLTIFMLSNKVPQLLSGIITGNAPSGMGIGQFGAGAALGATTMVGAMAGAMAASGTTQGAGGVSALMAAFSQANANVAAGSDVLANAFSGSDGGDTDGGPGGGGMPGTGVPFQRHCHEGHGIFKTVLGIRLLNFSS
ncbi:P-type conjugative transfer protein TrbL [Thiolapillus sp.]|uniref:P-type conjugative transfer protein TrbL n=1 Tax=Thiolapillus sp. TaxID=2017437 RepID=UPI003AF8264C